MTENAGKLTAILDYEDIYKKGTPREWEEWLKARLDRIDADYSAFGGFFALVFKDADVAFEYKMRWL